MKMVPSAPYDNQSRAELRVFDALKRAFPDDKRSEYQGFHSLNLTRHARKRFGEVDFVISCPRGLYALEVKGGGVSCRQGQWISRDRNGIEHRLAESPFKQAESGLHGLMNRMRDSLSTTTLSKLVVGYGVLFPDCDWRSDGAEWEPALVADSRSVRNIDRWLRGLFTYWETRPGVVPAKLDAAALRELSAFLRPEVEAIVPLHVHAREASEGIARLTESQMVLADAAAETSRILCSGGAGTGKTMMALEFCKRWTGSGLNIALVCKSPWLLSYLRTHFSIPNLEVSLLESLPLKLRRTGLEAFDAVIVDEGQDMLQLESLDLLDRCIKGGINKGRWCFFFDINNQAGFFGAADKEALDYLRSSGAAAFNLRKNCRNTRVILDEVKTSLGADMGVEGVGAGPDIRKVTVSSQADAAEALAEEIRVLVGEGGLSPAQITILSSNDFQSSSCALLPENLKRKIQLVDEYSLANFPPNAVSFARVADFKGLENDAIIVLDLPEPASMPDGSFTSHYVAMSRARAILSLIYLDEWAR